MVFIKKALRMTTVSCLFESPSAFDQEQSKVGIDSKNKQPPAPMQNGAHNGAHNGARPNPRHIPEIANYH
jgi:hypothetical protein